MIPFGHGMLRVYTNSMTERSYMRAPSQKRRDHVTTKKPIELYLVEKWRQEYQVYFMGKKTTGRRSIISRNLKVKKDRGVTPTNMHQFCEVIQHKISWNIMNDWCNSPFTIEEIKDYVDHMHPLKTSSQGIQSLLAFDMIIVDCLEFTF